MNDARWKAELILTAVGQAKTDPVWYELGIEERATIDSARVQLATLRDDGDAIKVGRAIQSLDMATRRLAELIMDAAVARAIREGR